MSKRPTIQDLAKAAGVSVATVDRVLNSRSKVRESTAQRVILAAEEIGYHASGLIRQRFESTRPKKRITILLQRSDDLFYVGLGDAISEAAKRHQHQFHWQLDLVFMDEINPSFILDSLTTAAKHSEGVALVSLDHPSINAQIESLQADGIPVISLISHLSGPGCAGHIGLDARQAGRSAAWTISRLAKSPGKIGILLGSHRYLNQDISEISFISYFREHASTFELLPSVMSLDDDRLACEATAQMLQDHPDLIGLYCAGGGTNGMLKTLRQERSAKDVIVVCNELTKDTREALIDGYADMLISTPKERVAQHLFDLFAKCFKTKHPEPNAPLYLPVELFIQENI
jgi:LacI family transcriptional regulator